MLAFNRNGYLAEDRYDIQSDPQAAALFTTGNGYMGVRGSYEEFGSSRVQGAYVRGLFDEIVEVMEPFPDNEYMKKYYFDEQRLKDFERQDSCVNFADFLFLRFRVGDAEFYPWEGEVLRWERYLNVDRAELVRRVRWRDGAGHVTEFSFQRFASYENEHLYVLRAEARPLNHALPISVSSGIDTKVRTGGQRVVIRKSAALTDGCVHYELWGGGKYRCPVAVSARTCVYADGAKVPSFENTEEEGVLLNRFFAPGGKRVTVEKQVAVFTGRDGAGDPGERARALIESGAHRRFAELEKAHLSVWRKLFSRLDVTIGGDENADRSLRFSSYHTLISAALNDSVHGLSAKSLSGERYNQFVWWDAEIYQLAPFFHTLPVVAKNMLLYRYRQLEDAKRNAVAEGCAGARYPFVSSVDGAERVWKYARHPHLQVHITADVGYSVVRYYENTLDAAFMEAYGLEMLAEIMRYWMTRSTLCGGRYEIRNVTGTDEHHPYVHNDAYTNYLVKLLAQRCLHYAELFSNHPSFLDEAELARLADFSERLYLPGEETGLIPQFDGYFDLSRELKVCGSGTGKSFQMREAGLYHLSQVIKQPDVMLLYSYINYPFTHSCYAENWDYYERMCEASSSLTYPVHAICSADNRRMLSFLEYFMKTVRLDIDDIHGCAWQGIHAGCAAGGYYAVLRGVFGMVAGEEALEIAPSMPPFWKAVRLRLVYHGVEIEAALDQKKLTLRANRGGAAVRFRGEVIPLCGRLCLPLSECEV